MFMWVCNSHLKLNMFKTELLPSTHPPPQPASTVFPISVGSNSILPFPEVKILSVILDYSSWEYPQYSLLENLVTLPSTFNQIFLATTTSLT